MTDVRTVYGVGDGSRAWNAIDAFRSEMSYGVVYPSSSPVFGGTCDVTRAPEPSRVTGQWTALPSNSRTPVAGWVRSKKELSSANVRIWTVSEAEVAGWPSMVAKASSRSHPG